MSRGSRLKSEFSERTTSTSASDFWTCPICRKPTNRFLPAYLSPFIVDRTGIEPIIPRSYLCDNCEHVFIVPFYGRDTLASIYTGYRNSEYTSKRDHFEPGYALIAPSLSAIDSPGYQQRREFYDFFMSEWSSFKGLVVDYGGGDGYFSRYVFPNAEIVVADESYERDGGDLRALMARADLFFATHVFEHLPNPRDVLEEMAKHLRPGVDIYIELPKPYIGKLTTAFEELEELHRKGSVLPFSDLLIQHEHIGHFSKRSAQALLLQCGFTPSDTYLHSAHLMGFLGKKD